MQPEFISHILELLESFGQVSARRMFGGHGIYRDGLMFGIVMDDTFFLKTDEHNRQSFLDRKLPPFEYKLRGKLQQLSYFAAPEEVFDDSEPMCEWARGAYAAALRAAARKHKGGRRKE